jgi:hypothetical protein
MIGPRYSSRDFYHSLVAIEAKVLALPCRGGHEDGKIAWLDLLDFIQTEREACSLRAAKAQAESQRKERYRKEGRKRGV